ncbi:hypothetical protein E2C01_085196 [Portunus trituberculatus]|uniref:Uncharacterized protein n=1 Tax=Portunus trituberculatus TaxID=210409 RepID=A0A5B7J1Z2_PORTR|nr:hypothetical protein [Portunus trituberculatus]
MTGTGQADVVVTTHSRPSHHAHMLPHHHHCLSLPHSPRPDSPLSPYHCTRSPDGGTEGTDGTGGTARHLARPPHAHSHDWATDWLAGWPAHEGSCPSSPAPVAPRRPSPLTRP